MKQHFNTPGFTIVQTELEALSPMFKQQIVVADSRDAGQLILFDKQIQDISESQQVSIRILYR